MERYEERFELSKKIRDEQYSQLVNYTSKIIAERHLMGEECFNPDFSSIEEYTGSTVEYRKKLERVIGYPPPHHFEEFRVREEYVAEDDLCYIYRLNITVDDDLDCYGLYLVPKSLAEKAPLILCFHGGGGCPELICNFERTDNYNDAARKFLERGFIVFAPLFSFRSVVDDENTDIPIDMRLILDIRAKWIGTSLAAIEIFKVIKSFEFLLTRKEVDTDQVGVAGLSYGGFYALMVAALEERIKFCISSCYFNDRILINKKYPTQFYDWIWKGSINYFSDPQLVALICPRPCFIEVGLYDELFPIEGARFIIEKAREYYKRLGIEDRIHYYEFEGEHEFNLGFIEELEKFI